jgi:peptidylprolyl isomerase
MIEEGKYVAISYTGKLENGEIFDSCEGHPPFEFQAGSGSVIHGLDRAVIGMKLDDEKDIIIEPSDAYGEYNDSLLHRIPLEEIKGQIDPVEGMKIGIQMDNGNQIPATITKITDKEVVIDANHPLAGKTLHFHLKIVDINDTETYPDEFGCGCGDSDCNSGCSC